MSNDAHSRERTTTPANALGTARDALAQAWAALPVWILSHPGVRAVYRAELAVLKNAQPWPTAAMTFNGMSAQDFIGAELFAFQEVTGCDIADEVREKQAAAAVRLPLPDAQIDDCMPMGMAPYVTLCGTAEIRRFARDVEAACAAAWGITLDDATATTPDSRP